ALLVDVEDVPRAPARRRGIDGKNGAARAVGDRDAVAAAAGRVEPGDVRAGDANLTRLAAGVDLAAVDVDARARLLTHHAEHQGVAVDGGADVVARRASERVGERAATDRDERRERAGARHVVAAPVELPRVDAGVHEPRGRGAHRAGHAGE